MEKRIERIIIKGLFDRYNYNINLNNGSSVAILAAPNGCGKTTIFSIVDFMFMPTISKLRRISGFPFKECICVLSNGKTVSLTVEKKKESSRNRQTPEAVQREARLARMGLEELCFKDIVISVSGGELKDNSFVNITKNIQNVVSRVSAAGMDYDIELLDPDISVEEMPLPYKYMLRQEELLNHEIRILLEKNDCKLAIMFIQADRLHASRLLTAGDSRRYRSGEGRTVSRDPLSQACKEIRDRYLEIREKYHTRQSEASEALPKSYLQARANRVSIEEFKKRWNSYIDDIKKFYEIGLLDSDETILSEDELDQAYDEKKVFLNVYLKAFDKTLDPLRKEYDRMKLFTDILNKRNTGTMKEMRYGKEGIEILVDGTPLSIECLSSGEKHDFIMFYNLIFKTERGSVVFIDEPEISLHINWQEEYIDRLLEICKINDLQAFVATHSPNIVSEHFDIMVDRGTYNGVE